MSVVHGALDHVELATLGLEPLALLDFSSNVNPSGPPPGVRQVLGTLGWRTATQLPALDPYDRLRLLSRRISMSSGWPRYSSLKQLSADG